MDLIRGQGIPRGGDEIVKTNLCIAVLPICLIRTNTLI